MIKYKEKKQAKILLNQGVTQKEVAKKLKVTEKTVGVWVKEFNKTSDIAMIKQDVNLLKAEIQKIQKIIKTRNI